MMKEPNTWKEPETHYVKALEEPWYKLLVKLENLISIETMKFYEKKGIVTMHLPVTTGSISSPMGKGSDSSPVKINIEGIDTYLADSMQFLLEYGCRLTDKGVYYVMPSFRGEKADERHLCQFYHSEAEIFGNLDDVIQLVEEYIKYLSKINKKNLIWYRKMYTICKKIKKQKIWIISDRATSANDNGLQLFKYLVKNEKKAKIYFVIDKNCPDYEKVKKIGKVFKDYV